MPMYAGSYHRRAKSSDKLQIMARASCCIENSTVPTTVLFCSMARVPVLLGNLLTSR